MILSWIDVYFQSIWLLSVVGEIYLTLTFSGKQAQKAQKAFQITVYTKWKKTVQNTFKGSYHLKQIWEFQWITEASYM